MKETLEQVITKCLVFASQSCNNYGKENATTEQIDVWLELAQSRNLTAVEFQESFMEMIHNQEDFPAWATFWKAHCRFRGSRLRDPVVTDEVDGIPVLGERAICDAFGIVYSELEHKRDTGARELPEPQEPRADIKLRLDAALARAESKVLGKPEPRVRTEYAEPDDPEQAAKHDERRDAIEKEQSQIEQARDEA